MAPTLIRHNSLLDADTTVELENNQGPSVNSDQGSIQNVNSSTIPPLVISAIQGLMQKKCILEYIYNYGIFLSASPEVFQALLPEMAFSKALAEVQKKYPEITHAIIHDDDGIDNLAYPECNVGDLVVKCAPSLPPSLWLQQRWAQEDLLKESKGQNQGWSFVKTRLFNSKPSNATTAEQADVEAIKTKAELFKMKAELYATAVKMTSFSASRAKKHCQTIANQPELSDVRECVRGGLEPALVELLTKQWDLEDKLLMVNTLPNPKHTSNQQVFSGFAKECKENITVVKKLRKSQFPKFTAQKATKTCIKDYQSAAALTQWDRNH
eukprot:gnl/MRDRNA2_/MRDRNA2_116168_c0_seq1.p1 gnl/MRDRNA2_/MRDRNA2_116168_c0~~gnl/MRDRNA2_/MRDRNA2_116168_c0_seq1.p1  ORF type:complete len:333 (-),score=62.02 gnl/MRDRNA2_/MRDRNA2_116168_c0_seq1:373-1347(-)